MKKLIFFFPLFLTGCSGNYAFHSNIDKETIKDYFKAADVKLFDKNHPAPADFQTIKIVNGEACQMSSDDKIATEADARTDARRKAADLGANGFIVEHCVNLSTPTPECLTQVMCSGKAIKIK
ncbi:Rcs stress response system protein RcsF [Parashewanella tropica]|uniref:Rcs stress response system protein RcsF n=1 Tax=Parashewanella tropica TaxID=2547970 RepID=UPI001478739E|nr:Rcs stress response system protein RcsF [Parashewanella tropica]